MSGDSQPERRRIRAGSIVLVTVATLLVVTPAASAKRYLISSADETFRIEPDASIQATERLTFTFVGTFHGAYRLIPMGGAERIDHVQVADDGFPDAATGSPLIGSTGAPGTFGSTTTAQGWKQVAWHFDATDVTRTFVVSYRMSGFIRDYRDVGNLYLQVWGGQWPVPVARLHVDIVLPGSTSKQEAARGLFRVWGHPGSVDGSLDVVGPNRVSLESHDIPAHQFVEVDAVFPSRLLTADRTRLAGKGLPVVVAREKRVFSSPYGAGRPATAPGHRNGGGTLKTIFGTILAIVLLPFVLVGRLFGFSGGRGSGGSFGGFGGGGGDGGGGGAW